MNNGPSWFWEYYVCGGDNSTYIRSRIWYRCPWVYHYQSFEILIRFGAKFNVIKWFWISKNIHNENFACLTEKNLKYFQNMRNFYYIRFSAKFIFYYNTKNGWVVCPINPMNIYGMRGRGSHLIRMLLKAGQKRWHGDFNKREKLMGYS